MKNKDLILVEELRRAYDSLEPDDAAKTRMLDAAYKKARESKKPVFSFSFTQKNLMMIASSAAAVAVLFAGLWFMLDQDDSIIIPPVPADTDAYTSDTAQTQTVSEAEEAASEPPVIGSDDTARDDSAADETAETTAFHGGGNPEPGTPQSTRAAVPVDFPSVGLPPIGIPSVGIPSVGVPSVGIPSTGVPSVGLPLIEAAPIGNFSSPPPTVVAAPETTAEATQAPVHVHTNAQPEVYTTTTTAAQTQPAVSEPAQTQAETALPSRSGSGTLTKPIDIPVSSFDIPLGVLDPFSPVNFYDNINELYSPISAPPSAPVMMPPSTTAPMFIEDMWWLEQAVFPAASEDWEGRGLDFEIDEESVSDAFSPGLSRGNFSLPAELPPLSVFEEEAIKADYINFMNACLDNIGCEYWQNVTSDMLSVWYYGTYNGNSVVVIAAHGLTDNTPEVSVIEVAGYEIFFSSSGHELLVRTSSGRFLDITDAYAYGLLSLEDVFNVKYYTNPWDFY
jgi:cell division septation protein DedD